MPDLIRTGGGTFDPTDRHIYFLALDTGASGFAGSSFADHILVPLDKLTAPDARAVLAGWIDEGKRVLMDSGVFTLAMNHARRHGISHDDALGMPPEQVDGFDELLATYLDVVRTHGDGLWGYIEVDLGGRDQKIKTRAMLEDLGLRPIPVYHPLLDGWDYFDYLAQRYDRICMGNIVQANRAVRLRLLSTLAERKKAYPDLWVHVLGLTPNEIAYTYPPDSADSSSWLGAVRWAGYSERSCGAALGHLPRAFQYELGNIDGPGGHRQGLRMGAYGAALGMQNWRDYQGEIDALNEKETP